MLMPEDKTYTMTTSSGSAAQSVNGAKGRRLVQVLVNPATSSTEYNFTITDKNSQVIYDQGGWTGKLFDSENIPEYIYGNFTMNIDSATADEAFTVILVFLEEDF